MQADARGCGEDARASVIAELSSPRTAASLVERSDHTKLLQRFEAPPRYTRIEIPKICAGCAQNFVSDSDGAVALPDALLCNDNDLYV